MADISAIGAEYCCSATKVSSMLENISTFSFPVVKLVQGTTSVLIGLYSPSRSKMAAIRTTRKKAVPFMLLEA